MVIYALFTETVSTQGVQMGHDLRDATVKRRLGIIGTGAGGRIEVLTRDLAITAEEAAELLRKKWQWIISATVAEDRIEVRYGAHYPIETIRQVITNELRYKLTQD